MEQVMTWNNRIVAYEQVAPADIIAHVSNYRKHPQAQRRALAATIAEVGYVAPVIVNLRTKTIVDGHLRVDLAKEQKVTTIPVIYIDVDEAEERKLLSTIDPITNMATIDQALFTELLKTVDTQSQVVNDMWDAMKRESKPAAGQSETVEWNKGGYHAFDASEAEKYLNNTVRTIVFYIQNDEYAEVVRMMDELLISHDCKSYQELFIKLIGDTHAQASN
jgi:hypothetical protein